MGKDLPEYPTTEKVFPQLLVIEVVADEPLSDIEIDEILDCARQYGGAGVIEKKFLSCTISEANRILNQRSNNFLN